MANDHAETLKGLAACLEAVLKGLPPTGMSPYKDIEGKLLACIGVVCDRVHEQNNEVGE